MPVLDDIIALENERQLALNNADFIPFYVPKRTVLEGYANALERLWIARRAEMHNARLMRAPRWGAVTPEAKRKRRQRSKTV